MELKPAEKRALKSKAQLLEPVVRLGSAGMTGAVVKCLDEALDLHELVKVRFTEFKEERKTLSVELAAATESNLIQVVGNVAVFYRKKRQAS